MKKPESLRELLLAAVPHLTASPGSLSLFIDKGRLATRATGNLSFEYRYTLNLVVQDFAGDLDALTVPILAWIAEQQPELLSRGDREPFAFEAELLDGDLADVSIDLELTERVRVDRRPAGGVKVTHLDEPRLLDAFDGVDAGVRWDGLARDLLIE